MGPRLPRPVPAAPEQHLPDQGGVLAQPVTASGSFDAQQTAVANIDASATVAAIHEAPTPEEPTLAATLRAFAHAHVPGRFYLFLQLGIPWSVQFWLWGWPHSAALMVVLSTFGMWALCEQALTRDGEEGALETTTESSDPSPTGRRRALSLARTLAGFVSGSLAMLLVFETFVRILFGIIRCPGCAG